MINRDSKIHATIELNEYIEKWSDIKDHLDDILDSCVEEIKIINDGCKKSLVKKIIKHIENHGIITYENN